MLKSKVFSLVILALAIFGGAVLWCVSTSRPVVHFITTCQSKESDKNEKILNTLSPLQVAKKLKAEGIQFDFTFGTQIRLDDDHIIKQSTEPPSTKVVVAFTDSTPDKLMQACKQKGITMALVRCNAKITEKNLDSIRKALKQ